MSVHHENEMYKYDWRWNLFTIRCDDCWLTYFVSLAVNLGVGSFSNTAKHFDSDYFISRFAERWQRIIWCHPFHKLVSNKMKYRAKLSRKTYRQGKSSHPFKNISSLNVWKGRYCTWVDHSFITKPPSTWIDSSIPTQIKYLFSRERERRNNCYFNNNFT